MRNEAEPRWLAHLHELRAHELAFVVGLLRSLDVSTSGASLLEIGAGTGAQAQELADLGFQVSAVDVAESNYTGFRVYPVVNYDGHHLPFADKQFDVVFSSNVLEHIPHVAEFQKELRRALADDGVAVHVLPTAAWRFWTSATYYVYVLRLLWNARAAKSALQKRASSNVGAARWRALARAIFPSLHGESGNWFTELWYFKRSRWERLFGDTGWSVVRCEGSGLFYTGYSILGPRLPPRIRRALAAVLGSATNVFLLRKVVPRSDG